VQPQDRHHQETHDVIASSFLRTVSPNMRSHTLIRVAPSSPSASWIVEDAMIEAIAVV